MPYINGKRVSQEEFIRANSQDVRYLHTGPNGVNPAPAPELDEETKAPKSKSKKPGSNRSKRSAESQSSAIADALGVSTDSLPEVLPDVVVFSDSDVEPAGSEASNAAGE